LFLTPGIFTTWGIKIIIINRFILHHKVATSEALGPDSVLVSRGRRESLGKEEYP